MNRTGSTPALRHARRAWLGWLRVGLPALAALLLAACDGDAVLQRLIPQEEAAEGRKIVAQLAAHDLGAIESRLDASLLTPDAHRSLEQLAKLIPEGPPRSVATIGFTSFKGETDARYGFIYEYEYDSTWMMANLVFSRKAGRVVIEGLHINLAPRSQKAIHAFTLQGKGPLQLAFLAAAIGVPLFIVGTLVVCLRTPVARRKWLWILFILLGVAQCQMNWTTGAVNVQLAAVTLLGAGFMRAGSYAPLILTFSLPLGAIVFLARRKALGPKSDASSLLPSSEPAR